MVRAPFGYAAALPFEPTALHETKRSRRAGYGRHRVRRMRWSKSVWIFGVRP